MTVTLHITVGLALGLGLLFVLSRLTRRREALPFRVAILIGAGIGVLLIFWLISAILYPGSMFGRIQLLSWTVFVHIPFLLAGSAVCLRSHWRAGAWAMAGIAFALGLVALDAFVIEPQWLEVNTLTLHSTKLTEPVRVIVLADIQTDRPGRYEAGVLDQVMALQPDLILFTGDYIQLGRRSRDYVTELRALQELLRDAGVAAPLGGYAVGGNVDQPAIWPQLFQGLPITAIETTTRYDLGPAVLTGLSMQDSFSVHLSLEPASKYHIVLGHSPNFALGPVEGDLLLAGHTHGGQVQLPFFGPLLTLTQAPRAWATGVTEISPGRSLVVSRGIGLERGDAPRLRFLCRPELVVIDLLPGE